MDKEEFSSVPPVKIETTTKDAVRVKAAQEKISLTSYIRAALRLWKRGDPAAQRIVEEARKKK